MLDYAKHWGNVPNEEKLKLFTVVTHELNNAVCEAI
jgi:hypothetical protein